MRPDRTPRDAVYWIETLALTRHPEGGYFRETYRASEQTGGCALPARFGGDRPLSTAIYFLLSGSDYSAFHRLRADELWHFYAGGSLTLHLIAPGGSLREVRLGQDAAQGEVFQAVVPAGCWFAGSLNPGTSYALVGCTVAPGFSFEDLELASREDLTREFPQHRALIERLTKSSE